MASFGPKISYTNSFNNNNLTLYEFLLEAELEHYYEELKNTLKIASVAQIKYIEDEDLSSLGMSKPEQRRLRKYFQKYFPQTYLKKIKKMILSKNRDDSDLSPYIFVEGLSNKNKFSNKIQSKHIIPSHSIVINKELGAGEFGVVQQGVWTNEDGERVQVAIKCLSKQRMQNNHMEFLKEAAIMHSIDHEHIVRLYGVVLDTDTLMLVTELAPLRSLLECLKEPALRPSFPVLSLCDFATQICDGMHYLESKRLIHRDLAARNILVFAKNRVKISDFGLSRALGVGKDYYQTNFNVNLKLPIAWCAPECINFLKFTSASDVWAYGVVLWEMFSYGFQPWAALTGQQILETIDEPSFQRLEQPECCPKEYYLVMLKCWEHDPNKRPKFFEISKMLPDCRPELVQTVKKFSEISLQSISQLSDKSEKDLLQYKLGDVITVLDKKPFLISNSNEFSSACNSTTFPLMSSFQSNSIEPSSTLWKGVLNNGKTGLFNPNFTVAYLGHNLPTSIHNTNSNSNSSSSSSNYSSTSTSFIRSILDSKNSENNSSGVYSSKRRLRPDMISPPQNDFKHTSHVGSDGAFFGDISFLGYKYLQIPKQMNASHKTQDEKSDASSLARTSSDLSDKAPLLTKFNSYSSGGKHGPASDHWNDNVIEKSVSFKSSKNSTNNDHEYHEITDENDFGCIENQPFETLDFGPSLMDEVFKELDIIKPEFSDELSEHQKSVNECNSNVKNEIKEIANKLAQNKDTNKKKQANVKPISASDQHNLESAIAMAKELATQTMIESEGRPISDGLKSGFEINAIGSSDSPKTPNSPNKKKFSFKFKNSPKLERRSFSQETENISDIQSSITKEAQEAYNTLIEKGEGFDKSKSELNVEKKNLSSVSYHTHQINENETELIDSNSLRVFRNGISAFSKGKRNKQRIAATPQTASLARLTANVSRSLLGSPPPIPLSNINDNSSEQSNALPLPPRDRSKQLPVLKQHQRKHSLLLPENVSKKCDKKFNFSSNEALISSFKPNLPLVKQTSTPESSSSYVNNQAIRKTSYCSIDQFSSLNSLSPRKICSKTSAQPNRSFLITQSLNQTALDTIESKSTSFDSPHFLQTTENLNAPSQHTINHHVSCEDLLDFAVDKPSPKRDSQRLKEHDSDAIRVMQKVLANEVQVSIDECMEILKGTDWDVHKAIKCIRLRETLKAHSINVDCDWVEMLAKFNWNIRQASNYLIATQGLPEDTTEV